MKARLAAVAAPVLAIPVLAVIPAVAGAGDLFGWHARNHYGTCDPCPEDVWEDMWEDVYGDDTLEGLDRDPCDLFHLGRGLWACPGCRYAPLHYESIRPCVLSPRTPFAGASWYRGVPVGHRAEAPLLGGEGPYDDSEVVP